MGGSITSMRGITIVQCLLVTFAAFALVTLLEIFYNSTPLPATRWVVIAQLITPTLAFLVLFPIVLLERLSFLKRAMFISGTIFLAWSGQHLLYPILVPITGPFALGVAPVLSFVGTVLIVGFGSVLMLSKL